MTMLWGRTGQKGFPRERLGRRPAVLGFYAWQYSGCPMKAGNLSESEGSDAFWVPLYSSIYLRESHVQGNRFDLENPGSVCRATPWTGNRRMSPPSPCSRREGRGMAGPGRCQDSLPSVSDRYPRLRGSRESTLVSPLSARSIPPPLGTRRRLRSPGSSVPLVRGVARWSVPDARPRGQLPGAPPPVLLPPAGWARLLPRKSPAWGTPVLRVL